MSAKSENWQTLLIEGKLIHKRLVVLDFILRHPGCDLYDISLQTGLPVQTASARLSELMDEGMVKEDGQRMRGNSTFAILEFVANKEEQEKLAESRRKAKFVAWLQRGLSEYRELTTLKMREQMVRLMDLHGGDSAHYKDTSPSEKKPESKVEENKLEQGLLF